MHTQSVTLAPPQNALADRREEALVGVMVPEPVLARKARVRSGKRRRRKPNGAAQAASQSLGESWLRYRRQLRRCQRKLSAETLHELRVQTRRMLVCLEVYSPAVDGEKELAAALRTLARRLSVLGPLRDAHVQLIDLDARLADFPELIPLHFHLHRRANRLACSVEKTLRKTGITKLGRRVAALRRHLSSSLQKPDTVARLRAAYRKSLADGLAILEASREDFFRNETMVHDARISLKHLRYGAEALPAALRAITPAQIGRIKKTTATLGKIHDIDVHLMRVAKLESKGRLLSDSLVAYRTDLARSRRRLVTEGLRLARKLGTMSPGADESQIDKATAGI